MTFLRCIAAFVVVLGALGGVAVAAEAPGRIAGRVVDVEGGGQSGVVVSIEGTKREALTDAEGGYVLARVPPGTYNVLFGMGENVLTESGVVVTPGQTADVSVTVDWEIAYAETVTVYAASRRVERIVDAPAAISVVGEEAIEKQAAHGQLPKLLEFTPGAEATQSGLYDYNLNVRGFNSSLNRRVATLIDGRDPSIPFLGGQEWAGLSLPLDDLAAAELLRGPGAALYGKNAASGVLNLTSKQPRYSEGGLVRLTAGELSTFHLDFRWAGYLIADWYVKVVGGVRRSDDFSRSRNGVAEYSVPCATTGQPDCLPAEVPLARLDDVEAHYGGLRVDKYWGGGSILTIEGGTADLAGPVLQTGIGRVQTLDVKRPWARARWADDHRSVQLSYTRRNAPRQLALSTGSNLALQADRLGLEAQGHWDLATDRIRLAAGASLVTEDVDSLDPATARQTLLFEPVDGDFRAVFGQLNYKLRDNLKGVVALRWDDSSLHDAELSPQAALVWNPTPEHTLRLTYNEAFQVASFAELFLQAPAGLPLDLSTVEGVCTAESIDCGFGNGATPVLAVGNAALELERVRSWELGWTGIFNAANFVTVDYYETENRDFITDLLPQCGTALGTCVTPADRLNPAFGPYVPPAGLSASAAASLLSQLQTALGSSFATLSNNLDGSPVLADTSYTNFGKVSTRGIDVSWNRLLGGPWSAQVAYSWFDYDIARAAAGLPDLLRPNSPEHKASAGLRFERLRFDAEALARWSDDFRWVVGPFQGNVLSYTTVDLNANIRFGETWKAGIAVANLLDEVHYESFGGDLLGRRALGHVTFSW